MIRLLLAELLRFSRRRAVLVGASVVVVIFAFIVLVNVDGSRPPSADEIAQSTADYEEARDEWESNHKAWEKECRDQGGTEADCAVPAPVREDFEWLAYSFTEAAADQRFLLSVLFAAVALVVTSVVVGGEASSGSLAQWLTVFPSRWRVLVSRLLATSVPWAVAAALATLLGLLILAPAVAAFQDLPTSPLWQIHDTWRVGGIVLIACLWAGSLTTLWRHSAGGIVSIAAGLLVTSAIAQGGANLLGRWNPIYQLSAILDHGTIQEAWSFDSEAPIRTWSISAAEGWLYWGLLTAVLVAVTTVVFSRRDVR